MSMTINVDALRALEKAVDLVAKATPGPWNWVERSSGRLEIAAPHGGGTTVMDFVRHGMNGAEPRFGVSIDGEPRGRRGGVLMKASELMSSDPDGLLRHPDAELLIAAVNFIREHGSALIAELGQEVEAVAPVAWGVMYPSNHPQAGEVWHTFPDQRDAKAAREAAWNGGDDLIVPLYTSPAHASEARDAAHSELAARARQSVSYSHNFATAKPDIGATEREHILGLCKLVEELIPSTLMAARETEDDGAAIMGRLSRALAKADPSSKLPRMAIDWLRSKGIHWKSHCPTDPLHYFGEPMTGAGDNDDLPAFLEWVAGEVVRRDTRAGNFAEGLAQSLRGHAHILRIVKKDAAMRQEAE